MTSDYYKILGLTNGATDEEVKQAYRKLAMIHHPDRGGDAEEFKKIKEAYEMIVSGKADTTDAFGDFFRNQGRSTSGNFDFHWSARNVRNPDIHITTHATLEEAHTGFSREIKFTTPEGSLKKIWVNFPSGSTKDIKIRYAGEGGELLPQQPPGDLYVKLAIQPHGTWEVKNHDLYAECTISVWDAMIGSKLMVTDIDGSSIEVSIPAGVQPGAQLRLKNRGMNIRGSSLRGNAFIVVIVKIPQLSSEDMNRSIIDLQGRI